MLILIKGEYQGDGRKKGYFREFFCEN